MAALEPSLAASSTPTGRGAIRALGIIALIVAVPAVGGSYAFVKFGKAVAAQVRQSQARQVAKAPVKQPLNDKEAVFARKQVGEDFAALAAVTESFRKEHARLPQDTEALYDAWTDARPDARVPHDPFDGNWYGYGTDGHRFWLWSAGQDMKSNTKDDIDYSSDEP
jgi:hypothetical protein